MITSQLRPLKNCILFQFVEETVRGMFEDTTDWGFRITTYYDDAAKSSRRGKVIAVGPQVSGVNVGDVIQIEPLMWTDHIMFEGEKIWKTDETKVLGIVED